MKKTRFDDYERVINFAVWSNYDVHVIFTDSIATSRKERYGTVGQGEDAGALHTSGVGGHSHLFFKIEHCPSGVIAHESWHAVYCLMTEWAGVKDLDNETVAYHLGYLVQKIVDFRDDLIDAGVGVWTKPNKSFGVKSSSRKKVNDGNKDSQGVVAGLQSVPTQRGGTGVEAGEAGTPYVSAQADGCGDGGLSRSASSRIRTRARWGTHE